MVQNVLKSVKTVNGNKIELVSCDCKVSENCVLIIGVFHGDEPQGEKLIKDYLEKVEYKTRIAFLPRLNSENTRVNKNGVDLNRNFPTENWEKSPEGDYYGGEEPASEAETKWVIHLIEKYSPKLVLTLHAPYKVVNIDGGNRIDEARNIAEKISEITSYPVKEDIGYPTPGSFGTWAGVERNIPVITLELDEEIDIEELKQPVFEVFELLEDYKGQTDG